MTFIPQHDVLKQTNELTETVADETGGHEEVGDDLRHELQLVVVERAAGELLRVTLLRREAVSRLLGHGALVIPVSS